MDDVFIVLEEMKNLCDKWFDDPMIQPYSGANATCLYCGAMDRHGVVDHSIDCPHIVYKKILEK